MSWHLAHSLVNFRNEINKKYPKRDKRSDGSIGDSRHSARVSDHNPNSRRSVDAIDIDVDGVNRMYLVQQAIKHPSTHYVIYNRTIWNRDYGFKARAYHGSDPHTGHIHVSIRQSVSAENSNAPWLTTAAPKPAAPAPTYPKYPGLLKRGSKGEAVKTLQARLNKRGYKHIAVDGDFGAATQDRVRDFQKFAHIHVDGIVGPITWKYLYTLKIT